MRLMELFEAAAPAVGRKYQHVEDLVFTGIPSKGIAAGADAALAAVRILQSMATTGGTTELKWDGSPVVYWGKDEEGRFSLIPKNAWEYLKRGKTEASPGVPTVMYSPQDIGKFILGTGKPPADKKQEAQRSQYAKQLSSLWPYFEKVSPEQGYLEGGLLFYPGSKPNGESAMPVLNQETEEYEFTPNITTFHINKATDLGKKIAKAKVMVAATGYYGTLGSSEEGRYPNAESLSTGDVIVQGTSYIEQAPGIESKLLDTAQRYIESNAAAIDQFLAPQPGLSKVGDILYKFYNQNLRIEGVKSRFAEWAKTNLSAAQANKVISNPNLDKVLTAVELLGKAKMDMHKKASAGVHGGIRQTKPEGYVYQDPDTGQFVKAIDQATWAPRKD